MLAIKLQRVGKKHQPSYRFVVAEKKSKMIAPPVEDLGSYNPFTKAATVNKERAMHWIKMGAQPTLSVHNLLVEQGIVSTPKKAVKIKKKEVVAEAAAPIAVAAPAVAQAEPVAEAPVAEAPTPETPAA